MARKGTKSVKKASKNVSRSKTWVMAVDPYSEFEAGSVRNFVKNLAGQNGAKVVASYVLAPASVNWTGDFSGPWMKRFGPLAEQKMDQLYGVDQIETHVIPCKESGQRAAVQALLRFVQKQKAEFLVLTTHARTGIERLAMGSFAETTILSSKTPVLILNPSHPIPQSVRRILVPTDITKKSEKYVLATADLAKKLGAEIILFYKQPDPLDPIVQQGVYSLGGGWVSLQSFIDEELARKTKDIEKLEAAIRKKGVTVSHVIDSAPIGLIDSINNTVKDKGVDMVTVLTQTGTVAAAILGSVARGLVRTSKVPVLVRR